MDSIQELRLECLKLACATSFFPDNPGPITLAHTYYQFIIAGHLPSDTATLTAGERIETAL